MFLDVRLRCFFSSSRSSSMYCTYNVDCCVRWIFQRLISCSCAPLRCWVEWSSSCWRLWMDRCAGRAWCCRAVGRDALQSMWTLWDQSTSCRFEFQICNVQLSTNSRIQSRLEIDLNCCVYIFRIPIERGARTKEERKINQTQWSVKRETRRRKISNWLV